jgi:hypothetical protein
MNRQKTFRKLILFCVFAKSTSFVKLAVKKVRNPRPGKGAFFMNNVEKKTSMVESKEEKTRVASNEQQLGRPCDLEHGMLGGREVRGRKVV